MSNDNTPGQYCLHCDIVAMIHGRFTGVLSHSESHEILRCLAVVAGDILSHGEQVAVDAYLESVQRAVVLHQTKYPSEFMIMPAGICQ